MLEAVDLSASIEKDAYEGLFPKLQLELRRKQFEAKEAGLPVLVVLEGSFMAGMDDAVHKLTEALDPRYIKVHPIYPPVEAEEMRPFLWRFWIRTPAEGRMAIFDRSWYQRVLGDRAEKRVEKGVWKRAFREINEFEKTLADGGTLVVKFWLHISRKEQKKRLEQFSQDPFERWRVQKQDWARNKRYGKHCDLAEEMFEKTSTAEAPWEIVPSDFRFYRRVKIFEILVERIGAAIEARKHRAGAQVHARQQVSEASKVLRQVPVALDQVDLSQALKPGEYEKRARAAQARLRELEFSCYEHRVPVIAMFEGWDAAGKGGTIERLVANLDPRGYDVVSIAAPSSEEKAQHYLWRFWHHLPKAGHLAVFDRSWYGRVLVERVEGFCTPEEWRRGYREIREFERQLTDFGAVLLKFWLHIDRDEQLRRFEERKGDPFKGYKLTDEDWRNRDKWDLYRAAVTEMLGRTSTTYAPWTVVEANDKHFARVKVLESVCGAVEKGIKRAKKKG